VHWVPRCARNDAACIRFLAALGMTRHALGWCCGASAPQARLRLLKKAKACVIPRHVVPRKLAHDAYALATARATLFPHHFIGRHWATTLGRPYASLGDHAGSPLRVPPYPCVPCGHDISCPCIGAPVIFATGEYLCTIHVQFSLRGLPDS
jgi:hypothetical protein